MVMHFNSSSTASIIVSTYNTLTCTLQFPHSERIWQKLTKDFPYRLNQDEHPRLSLPSSSQLFDRYLHLDRAKGS